MLNCRHSATFFDSLKQCKSRQSAFAFQNKSPLRRHLSGRNVCEIPTNRQLPRNLWLIPSIFLFIFLSAFPPTTNLTHLLFVDVSCRVFNVTLSLTRRFSTNFPQFHFSCVGFHIYFLVFDFLLDFFLPFFFSLQMSC